MSDDSSDHIEREETKIKSSSSRGEASHYVQTRSGRRACVMKESVSHEDSASEEYCYDSDNDPEFKNPIAGESSGSDKHTEEISERKRKVKETKASIT